MSPVRIFACLVASAAGLAIQNQAPVIATEVDLTCQLSQALPVSALALGDDDALEHSSQKVAEGPTSGSLAQKHAVLQGALADYKVKKQQFQLSTAKLMAAMETLLEVPSADAAALEKVASGKSGKDTLIVFYAPWCPHCQTFVLRDKQGNPTNAPLEVLRREFAAGKETKDVDVMRADVTKLGQGGLPKSFVVQGIPTVYFVNKNGEESKFDGNPHSGPGLKAFVAGLLSN